MTVPLQAGSHGDISSSSVHTNGVFLGDCSTDFLQPQVICRSMEYVFSMDSLTEDIAKGAGTSMFSSYTRDKKVLASLINNTYRESVPFFCASSDISELSETDVSLYKKESCLVSLKRFFLRILAILKKFFCRKKRAEPTSERRQTFKKSLLEGREKETPFQRTFKYILVNTRPPVLVEHSTQTDPSDFLKDASMKTEQKAFYLSLMLKDMWIKEEALDLYHYTWCMLTLLIQCLQDFYKFISVEEMLLVPSPRIRLSDELYLEWEQYIPNNEDLLSIICALLETLNGKAFSYVLEEYAVSDYFIDCAKKIEDNLLPSQVKIVLALIARHCMILISIQARELQALCVTNSCEAVRFVQQSSLLLSQIKKLSLVTWINLMQILANDAIKD